MRRFIELFNAASVPYSVERKSPGRQENDDEALLPLLTNPIQPWIVPTLNRDTRTD